jgi:predicted deacylase
VLLVAALCATPALAAPELAIKLTPQQRQASGLVIEAVRAGTDKASAAASRAQLLPGRVVVPNDRRDVMLAGVSGRVEAALVNPGDTVKAGQPLLRLYSAEVLGLQRAYLAAVGSSTLAGKRLARDEALFADGIIAESRVQDSRDQAAQAAAEAARQTA